MYSEQEIIDGCKNQKPAFQEALYTLYAGRMMAICKRYAKTGFEAEDVFHDAFVKVFKHIDSYEGGSFEGWMKKIFVRTAINNFHKNKNHYQQAELTDYAEENAVQPEAVSHLSNQELMGLIAKLPEGYRMVFNLHAIEGYSHPEIGEILNITEGTSRSQLFKAKAMLKQMLAKLSITSLANG